MMKLDDLRARLIDHGYDVPRTGAYSGQDRSAIKKALTDGPDFRLRPEEVDPVAAEWRVHPGKIWAFIDIESTGNPFINGRPVILPERHRFSKNTKHRFDRSHPRLSAPNWDRTWYPRTQDARYDVLLDWVALDVDAAFASCSYGAFQILGENHLVCEAATPWAFAWRQAQTEGDQFYAFTRFIEGNGLVQAMRDAKPGNPTSCIPLVRRYNGTAFRQNNYHVKYANRLTVRMK